jgi:transposase InsO family protein
VNPVARRRVTPTLGNTDLSRHDKTNRDTGCGQRRPRQENAMSQSTESKNKALVLRAFDTLFNKRDYAAAERFWSSNYIQHSAHIEPGREGLFNLLPMFGDSFAD